MIQKINAFIKKKKQIAENTTEIILELESKLNFVAGQYITVVFQNLEDMPIKEIFRDFSIASAPENNNQLTICFRNSDSFFKTRLTSKGFKGQLTVEGPKGICVLPELNSDMGKIVLIAGGIGITPFRSIILDVISRNLPYDIHLLFYNNSQNSTPYMDELKDINNTCSNIDIDFIFDFPEKNHFIKDNNSDTLWYIAGGSSMVNSVVGILTDLNVSKDKIHHEQFSGYAK